MRNEELSSGEGILTESLIKRAVEGQRCVIILRGFRAHSSVPPIFEAILSKIGADELSDRPDRTDGLKDGWTDERTDPEKRRKRRKTQTSYADVKHSRHTPPPNR